MTAPATQLDPQQTLIEPPSKSARTPVKPLSIHGRGIRIADDQSTDDRIRCVLVLDDPNPRGRLRCKVDCAIVKSWPSHLIGQALSVAAHWFRDIGGFQTLRQPPLKHIIQRLQEIGDDGQPLYTENAFHVAIDQYAKHDWHKKAKAWTDIGRFFTGEKFLDKWCPRTRPTASIKPMTERERKQLEAQRSAQQKQLDKDYAARQQELQKISRRLDERARKPKAATVTEAIERLSDTYRWTFFLLVNPKADRSRKPYARDRAMECIPQLWRSLDDSIRGPMRSRIFIECHNQGVDAKSLSPDHPGLRKLQLGQMLKALRAENRQPKPIGQNLERQLR